MSATLIAHLSELGTLNRKKIAALVGVAPFNRDSGKLKGKRAIGRRGDVRAMLYMSTLVAVRLTIAARLPQSSTVSREISEMALTACMRKLIVMLNAMLKAGSRCSEERTRPIKLIARQPRHDTVAHTPNRRAVRRFPDARAERAVGRDRALASAEAARTRASAANATYERGGEAEPQAWGVRVVADGSAAVRSFILKR